MHIFVLTATYELRVSRKSHLRDHPSLNLVNVLNSLFYTGHNKTVFFLQLLPGYNVLLVKVLKLSHVQLVIMVII
jgi:hypothetical protein